MFPKEPQTGYDDLYEETAAKHYTIASVFGDKTTGSQPTFQKNRDSMSGRKRGEPVFVREVKKTRSFTRPTERPHSGSPDHVPSRDTLSTRAAAESLFKPKL